MPLETIDKIPSDFWDALWCPVCGHRDFVHVPHARTFCGECKTHFTIEWNDRLDHGYVTADVEEAWCIVDDENIDKLKRYTEGLPDEVLQSGWSYSEGNGYVMTKAWGYSHDGWSAAGLRDERDEMEIEPRGKPATEWSEIARN